MTNSSNSSRIAKNTLLLYVRSFLILIVSLYTSRVVLRTLGIEDYGIYNVVGGIIGMIGFLNSTMQSTYQRYYNVKMGAKDEVGLNLDFKTSLTIQFILCLVIIIIAESVGLWFLLSKMVIPEGRMQAAIWVYQVSILSFVFSIISAPYGALIIAHEKMNIFAYISIFDVFSKLAIVWIIESYDNDRLILYAILLMVVQVVNTMLYIIVCRKNSNVVQFGIVKKWSTIKSMLSFASFTMIDSLSQTMKSAGLNIVLNLFFGPVVNAGRGVAYQILSAVNQFIISFQTAFRPQLTKSYSSGDYSYMNKLYYSSTKLSYYLVFCISLPLILFTPLILRLWLGDNVPENAVPFTRIILLTSMVSAFANPTSCIAYATGKIKLYSVSVSLLNLLIVPIAYLFLKFGYGPNSAMLVSLFITIIVQIVRIIIVSRIAPLNIMEYIKKVIIPTTFITAITCVIAFVAVYYTQDTILHSFLLFILLELTTLILIWVLGLDKSEKYLFKSKLSNIIQNKCK